MSTDANKALIRRIIEEAWTDGKLDNVDELVSSDYFNHAAVAEHRRGVEGFKHVSRWLKAAFPDSRFEIEAMIAEEDMVVVRGIASGTHEGEFMGNPPTGRTFSVEHTHWFRFAGGKLAEHWAVRDDLNHMMQFDLIPKPRSSS